MTIRNGRPGKKRRHPTKGYKRARLDRHIEPAWCDTRLFEMIRFRGPVYDPCCGTGRVVRAARAAGLEASGDDISPVRACPTAAGAPQNFLARRKRVKNIVANPPFDIIEQFTRHAVVIAERMVCLVWPITRLNAAGWLEDLPLARVLLMTPRPTMPPAGVIRRRENQKGGKYDFVWLVFDRQYRGPHPLGWLRRKQRR